MQWQNVDLRFLFLVPETSGVYVFTVGNQVVYVGQATNLQERIKQHFSDSETNSDLKAVIQHYRISVLYAEITGKTALNRAEFDLYNTYKPQCNQIAPPRC